MGVTFTSAAQRDGQAARPRVSRAGVFDLLLVATSLVAGLAIALAYQGRMRTSVAAEQARVSPPVNLNTVVDAAELEPPLAAVFASAADRRFAARELFTFLTAGTDRRRTLPNVGAIAQVVARADTIARSGRLELFAEKLRLARESAREAGRQPPGAIPLFTAAELAALKPRLAVRTTEAFRWEVLLFGTLYLLGFHVVSLVWRLRGLRGDRLLLAMAHLLTGVGFAILLSRPDPLRDTLLFVRFAEAAAFGLALMTALSLVDFGAAAFLELSYLPLLAALSLSLLLILFGYGPGSSRARVNLGPFQPIEAIRLLLALFLAGYFARRWELLREVRGHAVRGVRLPRWLDLPRGEYVLPVVAGVSLALVLFFLQKDLGPALFLSCVFLAVYAVARGRVGMALLGLVLLAGGFYVGYRFDISPTLAERVAIWQSPWDNAVGGGDQLGHAMWAMASGGPLGSGLGLGDSRYLPAGHTDLVLAAIGEELGAAGLILIATLYTLITWRGFRIGRSASNDYGFFLATALTLFLIVPVLVMAGGVMGVTPLTGVVTPFLSYGGSAMAANFAALGMLVSIRSDPRRAGDFTPFARPVKVLGTLLGVCAVCLLAVVVNVEVLRADDYLIRPHLGVQADGGRRYEYNPRILNIVRQLPRGTIYDRRGVPLASDDAAVLSAARPAYEKLGVSLSASCPNQAERCYPLGGRAFHILGDVRTRVNWTAPNTSYVERDDEETLRGLNDHAAVVQTSDTAGRPMLTVRRDYRDLVAPFRHRFEPEHPSVVALRNRPRDVRLTIDANLQLRVSSIVAAYARKASGRAAAVVLDPDTGELLASASYPWPDLSLTSAVASGVDGTAGLLDRARYGLYPPGSTFKLVTACAALRQDMDPGTSFSCQPLADGRVGARVKGWNRPIRDDVLDTRPHGTIGLHDALVESCNAYFAQLAVRLGAAPLLQTAQLLGISLTPSTNAARRVGETLPQVGYGQGDVVVSPLRMARVVSAIASNGVLRDVHWAEPGPAEPKTEALLQPESAQLLAGYMRDVVLKGTGRVLKNHPWRIAGKTGTAELTGSPSHGWFAGFAPYGPATRRIAFAIVVENAGYGGASAAPIAGEIVTAGSAAGLVK